jgi:hypothetical protein
MVAGRLFKFKGSRKRSQRVSQERKVCMEEGIKDILEKIKRTAEIILEHQRSRAFKNSIITLGAESIITMCKEGIDEIERKEKEG